MSAPLLVFDLDGTLIDTAPDLIDTLNFVFAREGLPPVPYATARTLIGGGPRAMIARGIEAEGRVLNPLQLDRLFEESRTVRALFWDCLDALDDGIMVGDSETDIRTAKAVAVPVVAVDFGYTERLVAEFQPDKVISHFAELSRTVATLA